MDIREQIFIHIISSSPIVRSILTGMVSRVKRCKACAHRSEREFFASVNSAPPALLMLDSVIAGKSAGEVLEEMTQFPALRGLPVWLLHSALGGELARPESARLQVQQVISKPFRVEAISKQLREFAERALVQPRAIPVGPIVSASAIKKNAPVAAAAPAPAEPKADPELPTSIRAVDSPSPAAPAPEKSLEVSMAPPPAPLAPAPAPTIPTSPVVTAPQAPKPAAPAAAQMGVSPLPTAPGPAIAPAPASAPAPAPAPAAALARPSSPAPALAPTPIPITPAPALAPAPASVTPAPAAHPVPERVSKEVTPAQAPASSPTPAPIEMRLQPSASSTSKDEPAPANELPANPKPAAEAEDPAEVKPAGPVAPHFPGALGGFELDDTGAVTVATNEATRTAAPALAFAVEFANEALASIDFGKLVELHCFGSNRSAVVVPRDGLAAAGLIIPATIDTGAVAAHLRSEVEES